MDLNSQDYHIHHSSSQSSLFSSDWPSSRAETPTSDLRQAASHTRSLSETLKLFVSAADSSKQAAVKRNGDGAPETSVSLNLDLKNQNIGVIPNETVDHLQRDRIIGLILSGNSIRDLPPRLSELSQLTYLNLRSNSLSEFPSVILGLSNLEVLDVSRNTLSIVPDDISKMNRLRFLSIRNNHITDLPHSLISAHSLRVIKLDGNPLTEPLWSIVNGNQVHSSPQNAQLNDNDLAVEVTKQIKEYLRGQLSEQLRATDSEISSQNESPLETPKALRRVSTARFPVKLSNGNSSETGLPPRSPNVSKPAIPTRSKQRMFSGSNGTFTATRRPGLTPLILGNERNRSQSESVVQATANARNKRMGMMSAKKLDSLEENSANRNSLHLRGISHASALRDRTRMYRSALGSGSSISTSPTDDSTSGIFLRRLSSVPERRSDNVTARRSVDSARGLVYSLHMFEPSLHIIMSVVVNTTSGRMSLDAKYSAASSMMNKLDRDLAAFDKQSFKAAKDQRRAVKLIQTACNACVASYYQLFQSIASVAAPLLSKNERRYLRTLILVFYGNCSDAFNVAVSGTPQQLDTTAQMPPQMRPVQQPPPRLTIQAVQPSRPVHQLPHMDNGRSSSQATMRRLRSDTLSSGRSGGTIKPSPLMPHSALPSYSRSRSNSRSTSALSTVAHGYAPSALSSGSYHSSVGHVGHAQSQASINSTSSSLNTPRSGDIFMMPESTSAGDSERAQAELRKVYNSISSIIVRTHDKMTLLISEMQTREAYSTRLSEHEAAKKIGAAFKGLKTSCAGLIGQMNHVRVNEPDTTRFRQLCEAFIAYANEWEYLLKSLVIEMRSNSGVWTKKDLNGLKTLHEGSKRAVIEAQKWVAEFKNHSLTPQQPWRPIARDTGALGRNVGHERSGRGDSDSSIVSSPFVVPTTPISAALGPAAQATMPAAVPIPALATPIAATPVSATSTTSTNSAFERPFRGTVFDRADALLNNPAQNPLLQPRARGAVH